MKIIKLTFLISIIFSSCRERTMTIKSKVMENTIRQGDTIRYFPKQVVRNDVIIFEYKNPYENKFVSGIMRVIAISGDTIEVRSGRFFLNSKPLELPIGVKRLYLANLNVDFDKANFLNFENRAFDKNKFLFSLSKTDLQTFRLLAGIDSIKEYEIPINSIDNDVIQGLNGKNQHHFGPLIIPTKNEMVTDDILKLVPTYFEPDKLGKPVGENLFFVICDNLNSCMDSRYIGLVPESSVKGVVQLENR